MKYLIVLMVLLSGCEAKPKFKVGDILCDPKIPIRDTEFGPSEFFVEIIDKVGKRHYLKQLYSETAKTWTEPYEGPFWLLDDYAHVCTKEELKQVGIE